MKKFSQQIRHITLPVFGLFLATLLITLGIYLNTLFYRPKPDVPKLPITSYVYLIAVGTYIPFADMCNESEKSDKTCKLNPTLFKTLIIESASGVKIGPDRIMTSSHVCESFLKVSGQLIRMDSDGDILINLKLLAIDHMGTKIPISLIALQTIDDLCVVEAPGVSGEIALISNEDPYLTERVWNVASPYGTFTPGNPLILDGIFSGYTSVNGRTISFQFTIPAGAGSSGSPVFRSDGTVVGLIHSINKKFSHISYASTRESISRMVNLIE